MNSKKLYQLFLYFFITSLLFTYGIHGQSTVKQHGRLQVSGNHVVDKNNEIISLAGNSLFWSNWEPGAKFYTANTVSHLAKEWKSDIVRAAMGVEKDGGYLANKEREKNKVKTIVEAAIAEDIYVIIDWHTHEAEKYQQEAIDFFKEMAQLYGTNDHVIYEIYNEPINQSWGTVKSYANAVVNAIRAIDPDNLIVVGTPQWSQNVVDASNSPLTQNNIAYTLHFYAGTHKQYLRDQATKAMNNGIALFVTEWGAVNADGNGIANKPETEKWMQFLKENGISHANWSVSDKAEGASVIAPNKGVTGLLANKLTKTGLYLRDIIENWNDEGSNNDHCAFKDILVSERIQAEDFCKQSGIKFENTSDTGGGKNAGYIDSGDYLEYHVKIPETGQYTLHFRVASFAENIKFDILNKNTVLATVNTASTRGWQNWKTVSKTVNLPQGDQTIRISATGSFWNINWFDIIKDVISPGPCSGKGKSITNLIQAEDFCSESGVKLESTTDDGSGQNVGYIASGDYIAYRLNIPATGQYDINFRVAALSNNIKFNVLNGTTVVTTVDSEPTGSWQNWKTITKTINLNAGSQTLRIVATGDYWNINWFQLVSNDNLSQSKDITVKMYPNPVQNTLLIDGINKKSSITITDFMGRTFHKSQINIDQKTVDVSSLKSGNYIITINQGPQKTSFQLIKK